MPVRRGTCSYPGILAVQWATYTCSHGITPGVIHIRCLPQDAIPPVGGDVVFDDGEESVTIPDCRIDTIKSEKNGGELVWNIFLQDRRWRWVDFGAIFGCYNQLDPHGKLIAWTIRSPTELAYLCLAAMGEVNARVTLPSGLTRAFGASVDHFLQVGQNFPQTGTNPPVNWDATLPAHALQQIADLYGCRVVYNLAEDAVWVVPIGVGAPLPDGSVARYGPTLKGVAQPDGIMVVGAPTKTQMRLGMAAVGLEWDYSWRPIEQLSYAPRKPDQKQTSTITFSSFVSVFTTDGTWRVTVNGAEFFYNSVPGDTVSVVIAALVASIQASEDPRVFGKIVTGGVSPELTLTGLQVGFSFDVIASFDSGANLDGSSVDVELTRAAQEGFRGWDMCVPPLFDDVVATDNLTYKQAQELAQRYVFKAYQVRDFDVSGRGKINVPGYGTIQRREQLLLLPTKCDQIKPELPDPNFFQNSREQNPDQNVVGEFIQNYYSGYSRDVPAQCYGSYVEIEGGVQHLRATDVNTDGDELIQVPFTIDAENQLVLFSECVYYQAGDRVLPSAVTLETGVNVRETETNQFACFTLSQSFLLAGHVPRFVEVSKRQDVQLNVIGQYRFTPLNPVDFNSVLTGVTRLEDDPIFRAQFYLNMMKLKYDLKGAETADFNGVVSASCDGAISQITWTIGGGQRASTVISRNCEHSNVIPTYPARRRAENLRPAINNAIIQAVGGGGYRPRSRTAKVTTCFRPSLVRLAMAFVRY